VRPGRDQGIPGCPRLLLSRDPSMMPSARIHSGTSALVSPGWSLIRQASHVLPTAARLRDAGELQRRYGTWGPPAAMPLPAVMKVSSDPVSRMMFRLLWSWRRRGRTFHHVDLSPKRLLQGWPPRLHQPGPPRLWKIGYTLIVCFVAALAVLAALWLAALALLSHPRLPHSKVISLHDALAVAQLVFASVAGAGALVALVVAYRRQRVAEATIALDKERYQATSVQDRTRLLNERFTTIAAQLGDAQAAVRLAGVHAMAGLADDWEENRQTCIDVLCAYLRMPY
jgi:hypothetical protein